MGGIASAGRKFVSRIFYFRIRVPKIEVIDILPLISSFGKVVTLRG